MVKGLELIGISDLGFFNCGFYLRMIWITVKMWMESVLYGYRSISFTALLYNPLADNIGAFPKYHVLCV